MKLRCRVRARSVALRVWAALMLCLGHPVSQAAEQTPSSVAFWYAENPPLPELAQFDWAVVEPGHMAGTDVADLQRMGAKPFAYLSVGEFDGDQAELTRNQLHDAVGSVRNKAWNSQVMDITTPTWRNHLFKRAAELQAQGYAGLFLDTLDSFQLLPEADREPQRKALASFLRELHQRQPNLKLLFNRGFEVLPELDGVAAAVAVESIQAGWDAGSKRFRPVPENDRQWLEGQLAPLRAKKIPLIAIDYLPAGSREQARQLAQRLVKDGYIPYVTTPELNQLGVSSVQVQPRRVAIVHDPREGDVALSASMRLIGGLLEYMGYRVDYLSSDNLPGYRFDGLYAGVLTWMTSGPPDNAAAFDAWLGARLDEQVPVVFMAGLPVNSAVLIKRLGLKLVKQASEPAYKVATHDKSLLGAFEAPLTVRNRDLIGVAVLPGGPTPALELKDQDGTSIAQVATAKWGGLALNPYVIEDNPERSRWILDPFAFLQKALQLSPLPRPDVTTENGRRVATVHIDGDGFPSRAEVRGTPYAGQYALEGFIEPYPFLTSVSVIEGELSPKGMFPVLSRELEPIARRMFANPKVEVATHTYSHPFYLQPELARKRENFTAEYGLEMAIPGYNKLDMRREIFGSRDYINSRLTTPEKPVKMVFWPGDALPGADTIKLAYEAGLMNVNGASTMLTRANSSLTNLNPLLRPTEHGLQYNAPITNENVYTNLWKGPYYGFRDLIETFELSDSPRRMRGLHLYYHFYSATKQASVKAMHEIYDYMVAQHPISLWMSDYIPRMHGLYQSSLARTADGNWQVRGLDALRTLRLDPALGWPDLGRSQGVAGVRDLPQGRYLHLSSDQALLALRSDRDPRPALEEANLPLRDWRYLSERQVAFAFEGQVDLSFTVRSATSCYVEAQGKRFAAKAAGKDLWQFQLPYKHVTDARLFCD